MWYESAPVAQSCGQARRQVQHVVVDEDCNKGCRDPIQNLMESWAWDMARIAFARRQCEGKRPGALVRETGHMWRRPLRG